MNFFPGLRERVILSHRCTRLQVMMTIRSTLMADVRWGVRWGLALASLCTVLALIGAGTDPSITTTEQVGFLFFYFFSGIAAGAVIGLLRQYLKTRSGAAIASIIAAMPVMAALGTLAWGPPWQWQASLYVIWLLVSIYLGILMPFLLRLFRRLS